MRSSTVAALTAAAVTCGLAGATSSLGSTAPVTAAPSGLSTVNGVLSQASSHFPETTSGWVPYGSSALRWTGAIGHAAAGALAVTSGGSWTGAASPRFRVTPGDRYTATTWVLARATGRLTGIGIRFFDANGAQLSVGNQVGQALPSRTTSWTRTTPVVGFAPSNAATAQVVFLDFNGPAGDVQLVDDVAVSQTSGVAAPIAVPLHTSGNQVLDRRGQSVTLRGVVIDGLEYTQWAQVSTRDIDEAHVWGANFVRIALAEDFVLPGNCGYDRARYLSRVSALVAEATRLHMVSLLDLHTNALVPCTKPRQQDMPDGRSVNFWTTMANLYKSNPYVAFDLYNEPHGVTDQVWRDGGIVNSGGVTYVAPGMQKLYVTVRNTGATNLVVVSGNGWASNFPTTAPLPNTRNVVYGVHAYTCTSGTPQSGAKCQPGPGGIYDPSGVLNRFTDASRLVPLVVTEFGFPDTNDGLFIANVTASVARRHWSGWCTYSFTGNSTGLFNLVKTVGPPYDPSIAGMAVVHALH